MVRDRLWIGLLGIGLTATALWAADVLPGLAFPLIGTLSALAWAFGPRLHDLRPRRPWRLLTAAALFFLAGVVLRALLVTQPYPLAQLGDAFSVCGFAFLVAGMVTFLSRWGINRHALLDGLIVCIGAAITSALLFILPATAVPGRPVLVSVLAGLYPLLDIVILLLGVNMAFTTAVRRPAFILLGAMLLLIFAGDLGYAVIGREGHVTGSPLLDLPYLLAFTAGGAAALHPSAGALAKATPLPIQAWSPARMLIIGPAVAAPFALTVLLPHPAPLSRWILGVGGAAIVALLLARASGAVQSHAAAQRRFEHQATHDPLTGLPNRRLLQLMVDRRLAEGGERVEIEVALRAAVAQEQLAIAYQPIVDLTDGLGTRTVGAEALVRWEHPVRGWLGPNMFIAVAEDANLISALGAWVLREAVQQLARWRAKGVVGEDFWMSVNVSPRQLGDAAFAERVVAILAQARVPARNLVLEITESVMVEGGELTERLLLRLRELGVRISVDDFGTGFSALGYLRRHPVTGVKIDRSFVGGLGASTQDEEIVRAVVAMSSALNLAVVAEGVETAAQRNVLAALKVPLAQGWLWGKAVPAHTFAATLRARERVAEPVAVRSD
ncbi:bifunctional diguanylate cyclase/phosphodiesterase [Dactylosporangium sp. NPDC000244]|uniref:putative bifunctional diguanylate cyclase/phosphodiesterase n=1 Tax=Dactylosporangium sp. NPDC000244 TaxID=3154365 RepID=UPI0033236D90